MKKSFIGIAFCVLLAGGAVYFVSQSRSDNQRAPQGGISKEFELKVVNKKLVEGDGVLKVNVGDTVVLTITSDQADEIHVHGYDQSVDVEPNIPATLSFVADASGRFPFELERSRIDLGSIEVMP